MESCLVCVCPGPHVFMCVPPRRVFIMFRVCVWTQQDPWEGWICFPFSLRLLDSAPHHQTSSFGRRGGPLHLSQVYSPADYNIGDPLGARRIAVALPSSFPRSRLTPPAPTSRSRVLGFPHLRHVPVFTLQHDSPRSS